MATAVNDSGIIIPSMPSLFHMALVKVAVRFLNEFDMETLNKVFTEIQPGCTGEFYEGQGSLLLEYKRMQEREKSGSFSVIRMEALKKLRIALQKTYVIGVNAGSQDNREADYNRAKACIFNIPALFRPRVLEAVIGLYYSVQDWRFHHLGILKLEETRGIFYWRSDGTIDIIKTIQRLVLNAEIDIIGRFHLACKYCMGESVQMLWAEMKASGKTKHYDMPGNPTERFWFIWLRDGSRIPWIQAIPKHTHCLESYWHLSLKEIFNSFSPLLRPEDMETIFIRLECTSLADIRFCIRALPKEKIDLVQNDLIRKFLHYHLSWPMQSFFVEKADKLWNYMRGVTFYGLLDRILEYKITRKDFDYCELFESFWNRSPDHLREHARGCQYLSKRIDACLNERKKIEEMNNQIKKLKKS